MQVPLRKRLQDCHGLPPHIALPQALSDSMHTDLRRVLALVSDLGSRPEQVVDFMEEKSLQEAASLCLRLTQDVLPRCHEPLSGHGTQAEDTNAHRPVRMSAPRNGG